MRPKFRKFSLCVRNLENSPCAPQAETEVVKARQALRRQQREERTHPKPHPVDETIPPVPDEPAAAAGGDGPAGAAGGPDGVDGGSQRAVSPTPSQLAADEALLLGEGVAPVSPTAKSKGREHTGSPTSKVSATSKVSVVLFLLLSSFLLVFFCINVYDFFLTI
jgi:hypothetical protein